MVTARYTLTENKRYPYYTIDFQKMTSIVEWKGPNSIHRVGALKTTSPEDPVIVSNYLSSVISPLLRDSEGASVSPPEGFREVHLVSVGGDDAVFAGQAGADEIARSPDRTGPANS